MELKPGSWVDIQGYKGQIVWISDFSILRFGSTVTRKELCLFTAAGQYRIFLLSETIEPFTEEYIFSRDRIGGGGM